jgi:hypothetical protein
MSAQTEQTDGNGRANDRRDTAQPRMYPSLEAWVSDYFTPMFLHRAADAARARWCSRWWEHAEAIARLKLLWNCWEAARWRPQARPGWWLDLDHHLPILLGTDGPLRHCRVPSGDRPGKHQPEQVPANEPAPPDWWD